MKLVLRPLTNCILHLLLLVQIQIKIELCLLSMGLSMCTKLQLTHSHAQEKTIDNRFPRNESRIRSSIKCKQNGVHQCRRHNYHCKISLNKTVRGMNGKIGCVGYNNDKILFAAGNTLGNTELPECYIKKLNCSHTLQS